MNKPNLNIPDELYKKYKPLIIKWLCKQFGYKDYPHSYKDQWINWNIWDNWLSISFDLRQEEHLQLMRAIPSRFFGINQNETLKYVNEHVFYLYLSQLFHIKRPEITGYNLLQKHKHTDNDGDVFYTYEWIVELNDKTKILYNNQSGTMDLKRGDLMYNSIIDTREFLNFLEKL